MKTNKQYRKTSITRRLCDEAYPFFGRYTNDETRRSFRTNYKKFITFCRDTYDCKTSAECKEHIQDYADNLVKKGCTASTVHTYLAPCCLFLGADMKSIEKPLRHVAGFTRGRHCETRTQPDRAALDNPKYSRSVELQKRLGIRRAELARLKGDNLTLDESGHLCVVVERGKGGKRQLQRILPEDQAFVKQYFNGKNEPVFSSAELNNDVPYHYLRAKQAQRAYAYYLGKVQGKGGKEYRKQLIAEMKKRFDVCCADMYEHTARRNKTDSPAVNSEGKRRKAFDMTEATGVYHLRGESRKFALKNGLPTDYDKTCLLAVSMFHLSHFRNNVTVSSYLLVI